MDFTIQSKVFDFTVIGIIWILYREVLRMNFEQYSSVELIDELKKTKEKVTLLEQDIHQYRVSNEENNKTIKSLENRIEIFESIFQTVPAGILIVDVNKNIIKINKGLENMIMKSENEVLGKKGGAGLGCYNSLSLTECGSGFICETCPLKSSVEYVLNTGKPLVNVEVNPTLVINDNIEEAWLRLNIVRTVIGEEKFAVLTIEDMVVERRNKQLEDKLKVDEDQINQLKEYDRLKDEFLSNISHEFRTPLNIILGTIQLLDKIHQQQMDTTDYYIREQKYIRIMRQNCYRLLKLIKNLIDIGKIGSGFFNMNLYSQNIVALIEDISLSTVDYINSKGINLVFDTDIEEKIMLCDAEKIERVMLNLLSNAIKHTEEKGTIMVTIYGEKDKILISVKDTGEGIPPHMQEEIFKVFRQVDSSFTRKNEGSGIGLYIVKSIIELHQGKIFLRSKVGSGSDFIIELPVRLVDKIGNINDEIAAPYEPNIERMNIEFSDIYK